MPNFFVDVCQDLVYAYGWPSRIVRAIWRVKRSPKRANASFQRFSCAIANHFLGDPDSDVKNAKNILWTSVKTFSMHTVGHNGLSGPFGGSNEPQASIRLILTIFVWVIQIPTSKMPNVFVDIRQDLVYACGWLSQIVRAIWRLNEPQSEHMPHFDDFCVL